MSWANIAEPLSDLSHDFVDLERLQESRFLLQFCTPFHQNLIRSVFLVIALINNLLDGHFPFLKTHRLFLFDFGVRGDVVGGWHVSNTPGTCGDNLRAGQLADSPK